MVKIVHVKKIVVVEKNFLRNVHVEKNVLNHVNAKKIVNAKRNAQLETIVNVEINVLALNHLINNVKVDLNFNGECEEGHHLEDSKDH